MNEDIMKEQAKDRIHRIPAGQPIKITELLTPEEFNSLLRERETFNKIIDIGMDE